MITFPSSPNRQKKKIENQLWLICNFLRFEDDRTVLVWFVFLLIFSAFSNFLPVTISFQLVHFV